MLNVIYKDIVNFEGQYFISNTGIAKNTRKELKTHRINSGYLCLKFTVNGKRTNHLVHRLVAEAFIPNPDNKREVNHIDGNKLNNNVCNLEWVTSSENKLHAKNTGLKEYNFPSKGKKLSTKSKYYNVGYDSIRNKWRAGIRLDGKTYYQKRFDSEEEAALHVNWALDQLNLHDRPRNII
jgi:hypothetical protein